MDSHSDGASDAQTIDPFLINLWKHPLSITLSDLREASDYAHEEGFPILSNSAMDNAERPLKELHKITTLHLEVYPTPDGEIACLLYTSPSPRD